MQNKIGTKQQSLQADTTVRLCLICDEPTIGAHMGIDACRACYVFYRRVSKEKDPLRCKTGLERCDKTRKNRGMRCQKCRFDRFKAAINQSKAHSDDQNNNNTDELYATSSSDSDEFLPFIAPRFKRESVIASIRRGYLKMNTIRRVSELSTRQNDSDPMGIIVDGMVVIPTTRASMDQNNRILFESMFEFASAAFEEFTSLGNDDQWQLVRNFFPFIHVLDSEYRMMKLLPEKETMRVLEFGMSFDDGLLLKLFRCFTSYTTYFDYETISRYVADTPNEQNREDATRIFTAHLEGEVRHSRAMMRRWNPTEDELMAYLGIGFWTLDSINASESIHRIADKYRRILMLELDQLYRERMGLEEYSKRMGEAMVYLESIQRGFLEMRSKIGVLKILDVIDEEMLMAQLHL